MWTLILGMTLLVLVATIFYAAPMTVSTITALGGGTDTVAHCDTNASANANVGCDVTGIDIVDIANSGAISVSGEMEIDGVKFVWQPLNR